MADVFISYCHSQRQRVAVIRDKLQDLKLNVWFDASLQVGGSFGEQIRGELDKARAILVCWEPDAKKSEWVRGEATLARERRTLVPCMLEPVQLDPPFNILHAEDLSRWEGEDSFAAWLKIFERIGELTERPGLARYAQIIGEGAHAAPLREWATNNASDPLADVAWERLELIESESGKERIKRERRESKARDKRRRAARRAIHHVRQSLRPKSIVRRTIVTVVTAIFLINVALIAAGPGTDLVRNYIARENAKQDFQRRRLSDMQNNAANVSTSELWRAVNELRVASQPSPAAVSPQEGILAARAYLETETLTYRGRLLIPMLAARRADTTDAQRALFEGVSLMIDAERTTGRLTLEENPALAQALHAFETAERDPSLASLAVLGRGLVRFRIAGGDNFSADACAPILDAFSPTDPNLAPRAAYWAAQCVRKLGQRERAVDGYAYVLEALEQRNEGATNLLMQAYHGLGTALISPDLSTNAAMSRGYAVARGRCISPGQETGQPNLAVACLQHAVSLRREMGQTQSQIGGTQENIGLAYLAAGDAQAAYDQSFSVETNSIFAWNELVRVISARRVGDPGNEREATWNIGFMGIAEFNTCELRRLMRPADFQEALALIREQHPGQDVPCAS